MDKKKEFKVEIAYIVKVESVDTFNSHLLPLSGFYNFDFSFSILLNIISDNMPILFL